MVDLNLSSICWFYDDLLRSSSLIGHPEWCLTTLPIFPLLAGPFLGCWYYLWCPNVGPFHTLTKSSDCAIDTVQAPNRSSIRPKSTNFMALLHSDAHGVGLLIPSSQISSPKLLILRFGMNFPLLLLTIGELSHQHPV